MEAVSESIKAVCCISVGIFIIDFLCSATRFKNQMKFLLSMVFLAVLITPIASGVQNIDLDCLDNIVNTESCEASAEVCNNVMKCEVEKNIAEVLRAEFERKGINNSEMKIDVNISETNSIDIKRVTINTKQYSEAEQILNEQLGGEVEIINEAESEA